MLERTFCHLRGVGLKTEQKLWQRGIHHWDQLLTAERAPMSPLARGLAADQLHDSAAALAAGDARFFAERLPAPESWRLFAHFRDRIAYIDIETTGLGVEEDHITAISLYDGRQVRSFVYDDNLADFEDAIAAYPLLVSFNGKCFDVPMIERHFRTRLDQAHIDLRYVLQSLGYRGGLKAIEGVLGIDREDLRGVDGAFAIALWHEFRQTGDEAALRTLLAYNVADVINLELLLVHAFNQKLVKTPFHEELSLDPPPLAPNPYAPDLELVQRLRQRAVGLW